MTWLHNFRTVALGFSVFAAIVELSLGARVTALITELGGFLSYESLAIAVGVITLVTVGPMLAIDYLRTGAFTSMVLVELVWLSILWVLWLAEGALTVAQTGKAFSQTCNFDEFSTELTQVCNATRAIEAFSFLTWIVLLAYTSTLLIVACLSHSRGAPIWTSSVKQHERLPPATPSTTLPQTQTQGQYSHCQPQPQPQQQQPIQMQMYGASPAPMPTPAAGAYSSTGNASVGHNGRPQVCVVY